MTEQERYYKREVSMQHFRWATPAGLFVLTLAIGFVSWVVVDDLTQIRSSIIAIKDDGNAHYDKLWSSISTDRARVECIQNQLAKCCKDSVYCA